MDLLDRLLGHDAWTTRELLARCEGLSDEQLDRDFDIGPKTVRRTLAHVIGNVGAWSDLMEGRSLRPLGTDNRIATLTARLDEAAADTSREKLAFSAMIVPISFSIRSRSSGVKGRSTRKSYWNFSEWSLRPTSIWAVGETAASRRPP